MSRSSCAFNGAGKGCGIGARGFLMKATSSSRRHLVFDLGQIDGLPGLAIAAVAGAAQSVVQIATTRDVGLLRSGFARQHRFRQCHHHDARSAGSAEQRARYIAGSEGDILFAVILVGNHTAR